MRRARRIGLVLLITFPIVAAAAGAYGVLTVRSSFPVVEGTLRLPGLKGAVEVRRDAYGVPHLVAETAEDLFAAQGFVHAQDRFWEMDVRRHVTAGRLSELFGATAIETDAFIRALGWRRVAEAELDLLADDTVRYLEAYARGVNAYLAERTGAALSLEYAILGLQNPNYVPEPWLPADSVAWLKAMAWDLRGNMEEEAQRAVLATVLPPERIAQLYPDYPYDRHAPIVTSGAIVDGAWDPDARAAAAPGAAPPETGSGASAPATAPPLPAAVAEDLVAISRMADALPALVGTGGGIGSNAMAVSGERTASGAPLLANDPHLAPSLPGIWHQMGLHCRERNEACPFDVSGFTFSGVPGVVIGHNDRVAWGFTNLGPDVSDLYLERLEGDAARIGSRLEPLHVREERINVAGGEPVVITVRATRHGPLLSDVSTRFRRLALSTTPSGASAAEPTVAEDAPDGTDWGVALRWTALEPGRTADAIFMIGVARDFDDLRQAARRFEVPAQNIVYADVDGHIGYQAPGKIPIRGAGDGRWPAPGWDPAFDWAGYIPFDELPWVLDPPEGFIVSANQAVTGPDYPHLLTQDFDHGYRGQRLIELLRDADGLDVEALAAMQLDAVDAAAAAIVPYLLDVPLTDPLTAEARSLLADWDAAWGADSAAAAVYAAAWRQMLLAAVGDELGGLPTETATDLLPSEGDRWFEVIRALLETPEDPWWDDVTTTNMRETRDEILARALVAGGAELRATLGNDPEAWRWSDLHTLELRSGTFGESGIGPVEWLFNRGPLPVAGSEDVVNATGWTPAAGYSVDWVPSMRMVVDLGDLDASRWVNLTGASGHAFHEHYDDQSRLWARGETTAWRFSLVAVESGTEELLVLER